MRQQAAACCARSPLAPALAPALATRRRSCVPCRHYNEQAAASDLLGMHSLTVLRLILVVLKTWWRDGQPGEAHRGWRQLAGVAHSSSASAVAPRQPGCSHTACAPRPAGLALRHGSLALSLQAAALLVRRQRHMHVRWREPILTALLVHATWGALGLGALRCQEGGACLATCLSQ